MVDAERMEALRKKKEILKRQADRLQKVVESPREPTTNGGAASPPPQPGAAAAQPANGASNGAPSNGAPSNGASGAQAPRQHSPKAAYRGSYSTLPRQQQELPELQPELQPAFSVSKAAPAPRAVVQGVRRPTAVEDSASTPRVNAQPAELARSHSSPRDGPRDGPAPVHIPATRVAGVDSARANPLPATQSERSPVLERSPSSIGVAIKVHQPFVNFANKRMQRSIKEEKPVKWQYFDGTVEEFLDIPIDYVPFLETAYNENMASIDLGEYKYDFRRMSQTSNFQGFTRELRRVVDEEDDSYSGTRVDKAIGKVLAQRWDNCVVANGTVIFKTPKFGTGTFSRKTHTKPFVIVKNTCEADDLAEIVLDKARFGLRRPRSVISITGGAMNFDISNHMREELMDDIIQLARSTRSFIVTGGTNVGVMQLAGHAVRDNPQAQVDCVGFVPLHQIHKSDGWSELHGDRAGPSQDPVGQAYTEPIDPTEKGTGGKVLLQENHSHYVFVDSPANEGGDYFGGEIQLRASFEEAFAKYNDIRLILVVAGGGPGTINQVIDSLSSHNPILIVRGSGGMADILALLVAGDEGVIEMVKRDLKLKDRADEIMIAAQQMKKFGTVHIVDYDDHDCGSAAQVILNNYFAEAMDSNKRGMSSLTWINLLETYVYTFDDFQPVLEALTKLCDVYKTKRGYSQATRDKARMEEVLQYVLYTCLRHRPLDVVSKRNRAELVDFVLRQL